MSENNKYFQNLANSYKVLESVFEISIMRGMQHGFHGCDQGTTADFWGQEVEMLYFERILQDATDL